MSATDQRIRAGHGTRAARYSGRSARLGRVSGLTSGMVLRRLRDFGGLLIGAADHLVPKSQSWVLYSNTDTDDQMHAVVEQLGSHAQAKVTWLVARDIYGTRPPVRLHRFVSVRGIWAYLRAPVVVHSMWVGRIGRFPANGKRFLNLWHGMPIKVLESETDDRKAQRTVALATSALHAENLAKTWRLPLDRVLEFGLPRNDLLFRSDNRVQHLLETKFAGRPLLLWLPTYRRSRLRPDATDGTAAPNGIDFGGATPETLSELAQSVGVHILFKCHPLSTPAPDPHLPNLSIWSDREFAEHGLLLYQVMAQAAVLITDYSSAWIDFLLTGRPIVFAISDLAEYTKSRGFYFPDISELVPGPIVRELPGLERELLEALNVPTRWSAERARAMELHHGSTARDGQSSVRAVEVIESLLDGTLLTSPGLQRSDG